MRIYLPHHLQVDIGQLRVHQLEIKRGRARRIPTEERIYPVCQMEVESQEHFVIQCPKYFMLGQGKLGHFLIAAIAAYHKWDQSLWPRRVERKAVQQSITKISSRKRRHVRLHNPPGLNSHFSRPRHREPDHDPTFLLPRYWIPWLYQDEIAWIRLRHDLQRGYHLSHSGMHLQIIIPCTV
ncbi:hypothetical protein KP509_23G083900 [Ceratopteris richardii]|uniref:Uncharacterized protein n=1 Tax=Ceratopteris richardii TaxID=49495 RepID=A0A8T2S3P8_CERRI|nr:hypothetical protein KP509_23G083900 [Ceratopteris richardii]